VLGLCDRYISGNRFIYPFTILGTAVISVIYAIDGIGISLGFLSTLCRSLPLYSLGFGWVIVTVAMLVISFVLNAVMGKKQNV
jgi:LIVCS family branched-chain amino acid:cation transporter